MTKKEYCALASEYELSRATAMTDNNTDKLRAIFSDDLYYGHSGGFSDSKNEFIEKMQSGYYKYHFVKTIIHKVIPVGKSGMTIHGLVDILVTINGIDYTLNCIYLAVWKKEKMQWRFLAHQTGRIPENNLLK